MRDFIKNYWDFVVYIILVIIALSPYIYTNNFFLGIDYITGPEIRFIEGQYYPNYTLWIYIQKFLSGIIGNILAQKIFIIGIFIIGFFSIKSLLKNFTKNKFLIFVGVIFFIFSPFIYPRLLQGQFYILYAHVLLPFFLHFLITKKYIFSAIIGAIILSFSPHFIFILGLIGTFYAIFFFKDLRENIDFKKILVCLTIIFIFNSYWIFDITSNTNLANFGNDFYNFSSKSIYFPNIYLEILSLNGFWGDGFGRYALNFSPLRFLNILFLIGIFIFGIYKLWRYNKRFSYFSISLFIIGFILSIGVSENNIFSIINTALYNNFDIYKGLRESNKFSSILSVIYSIGIVYGLSHIRNFHFKIILSTTILTSFSVIQFIFLQNVQGYNYPTDWHQMQDYIPKTEKVLALPWHQSLSLSFANGKIVTNPSGLFFGENLIVADNIELNGIYSQSSRPISLLLNDYFKEIKQEELDNFIKTLEKEQIFYILLLKELDWEIYRDFLKESLNQGNLNIIKETENLILYQLKN